MVRISPLFVASVVGQDVFLETTQRVQEKHIGARLKNMMTKMTDYSEDWIAKMSKEMASRHASTGAFSPPIDSMLIDVKDDPQFLTKDKWVVEQHPVVVVDDVEIQKTTYSSPVIELYTGEAHFSINDLFHMPYPKGDYTILDHKYRMVQTDGASEVPITEVYPHHWLIGGTYAGGQDPGDAPLNECQRDFFWGGGSEFRNMSYAIADGYGFKRIGSRGWCGANFHFLRVDDLKTHWNGFNDPAGDKFAAIKNCIECGWAPNRAAECSEADDGSFLCCFTLSRCPVNKPLDKTKKGYRFQYDVTWTTDMGAKKAVKGVMLDHSGVIEWNIRPDMVDPNSNTVCSSTICKTEKTWTVGPITNMGSGVCPGTMLWAYLHQHNGAINGSMIVNGETHCTNYPIIGTDPTDPAGNEKGFIAAFTECVNSTNQVRLNAGDKVTITGYYDVDESSTMYAPVPGGKHGGVMGLYFAQMDCDAGTFDEVYVCRASSCVPTWEGNLDKTTEPAIYSSLDDCQAGCN